MSERLKESELITRSDGSIYHLALKPGELSDTIILVGDPERVPLVSRHFDKIEISAQSREFKTHTGIYKGRRISVISTGIGTDNIDIVLNEADALFNVDFTERKVKEELTKLTIIRLGTCGGLQEEIATDDIVVSKSAIGFDGLLHFYQIATSEREQKLAQAASDYFATSAKGLLFPYAADGDQHLVDHFKEGVHCGITTSCTGFYAPQGRKIRLTPVQSDFLDRVKEFRFGDEKVTNFEMETSGILGLGKALGHSCVSLSTVVANRVTGKFSEDAKKSVVNLIAFAFERIEHLSIR